MHLPIVDGREHLNFRCTSCGNCCRELRVAVTHLDVARLAQSTGDVAHMLVDWLGPDEVDMNSESASVVELDVGRRLMVLAQHGGACRWLDDALRCRVYAARPYDCRLYPFSIEPSRDGVSASLSLLSLTACEDTRDGRVSAAELAEDDHARFVELAEYHALVSRWNRLARHRRRLGHRARSAHEFHEFSGRLGRPER